MIPNVLVTKNNQTTEARWVFPSDRRLGQPESRTWIRVRLHEVGDMVGIHLHPHLFRHTVATELLESGADIRDVQAFLGHASISTTQIYTQVRPARLQEAVERLSFAPRSRAAAGPQENGKQHLGSGTDR
jgi:site-specific recombinase XerD